MLDHIRIVLVEPAGPLNVGSVARVMKNFGLSQLVLVNPRCDRHSSEACLMAVHAKDLLEQAVVVSSIPEALVGVQRAIATTGETHDIPTPLETPRQVLPWLLSPRQSSPTEPTPPCQSALIFGREDRGLSGQELHYAQRLLQIPSHSAYTSLNLAQAVAVCCYELGQIAAASVTATPAEPAVAAAPIATDPAEPPASADALEGYYQQFEALMLKVGYLLPHTAQSRMKRFRRLYNRAQPSDREVKMLRGILRQMHWALHNLPRSE